MLKTMYIHINPTFEAQCAIIANGDITASLSVPIGTTPLELYKIAKQYNVNKIQVSGSKDFTRKIVNDLRNNVMFENDNIEVEIHD